MFSAPPAPSPSGLRPSSARSMGTASLQRRMRCVQKSLRCCSCARSFLPSAPLELTRSFFRRSFASAVASSPNPFSDSKTCATWCSVLTQCGWEMGGLGVGLVSHGRTIDASLVDAVSAQQGAHGQTYAVDPCNLDILPHHRSPHLHLLVERCDFRPERNDRSHESAQRAGRVAPRPWRDGEHAARFERRRPRLPGGGIVLRPRSVVARVLPARANKREGESTKERRTHEMKKKSKQKEMKNGPWFLRRTDGLGVRLGERREPPLPSAGPAHLRHLGAQLCLERHCLLSARARHVQRGLCRVACPHSHVHLPVDLVEHSSQVFRHLRIARRDESGFAFRAQRDDDWPLSVERVYQRRRQRC